MRKSIDPSIYQDAVDTDDLNATLHHILTCYLYCNVFIQTILGGEPGDRGESDARADRVTGGRNYQVVPQVSGVRVVTSEEVGTAGVVESHVSEI